MTDTGETGAPERQPFMERIMFRSIPAWILFLTIFVGALVTLGFGALVVRGEGGKKGGISGLAHDIASMPMTLARAAAGNLPFSAPKIAQPKLPAGFFRPPGAPVDPGFLLMTRYDVENGGAVIEIVSAADGKTVKRYPIDMGDMVRRAGVDTPMADPMTAANYQPAHPMLMPDGGLMFKNPMSSLVRVDACGKVQWVTKGLFHHTIEQGPDGDYWIPMALLKPKAERVGPAFRDDAIVRVSADGKIQQQIMLRDVLAQNGLSWLWEGGPYVDDPFHLNDIQPVFESGPYWERGDLFVSVRNLRMVFLYRPSTGKILWHEQQPWIMQHDVSILDDHRIAVFNNNVIPGVGGASGADFRTPQDTNEFVVYDFATGETSQPYRAGLSKLRVRTISEGRGLALRNGDLFAEESNFGRVIRMTPDGTLRWRYVSADKDGARFRLGWTRYLTPEDAGAAVRAAESAKCG